jgi:uncharacterized membrane protein
VYGFLWRVFPGGLVGKLLCSLVLLSAVVAVLFLFVFPRVEQLLPFQDVTVQTGSSAP